MYELLNAPASDVVAVRISGKIDEAEYDRLVTERLRARGPASLLLVMEDFDGWRGEDDDTAPGRAGNDVRHVAMVGKRGSWVWRMAAPFADADVRYFAPDRLNDACAWLRTAH